MFLEYHLFVMPNANETKAIRLAETRLQESDLDLGNLSYKLFNSKKYKMFLNLG